MYTHVQNFARIKTTFLQPQHLLSQRLIKCLKVSKLPVYSNLWDFLYLCNSKIIAILTDKIKPEKHDAYPVQLY